MSAPEEIPLFPLGTVLFPGGLLPLRIFEQRYMDMCKSCLRDGTPFGVCLIREGAEVGAPAVPMAVGCLARIVQWDMEQLGLLQIVAQGERRFRILEHRSRSDGLVMGIVDLLPEESDGPLPAAAGACRELLERIAGEHGERLFLQPYRFDSCAWVSARLAEVLPLPAATKQQMLEMDDGRQRLGILQRLIQRSAGSERG
jgi:hypothetical protein